MDLLWSGLEQYSKKQISDLKTYLKDGADKLPNSLSTKTLVLVANKGLFDVRA